MLASLALVGDFTTEEHPSLFTNSLLLWLLIVDSEE